MRELSKARLTRKLLLAESTQCFHLEFTLEEVNSFAFEPGQFVSCVAMDSRGKQQTRAYSIASAPRGSSFDLCVNRVENGFFSNLLCDLEVGQSIDLHGPHGMFTLHQPVADGVLIASDTGVAPMRAFVEWLFPQDGPDRSEGRQFTLLYGTGSEAGLYYRSEFEQLAAAHTNFAYQPVLSVGSGNWPGARGKVQDHTFPLRTNHSTPPAVEFDVYAYICGLNEMVAPCREQLKNAGVSRRQILFERYD